MHVALWNTSTGKKSRHAVLLRAFDASGVAWIEAVGGAVLSSAVDVSSEASGASGSQSDRRSDAGRAAASTSETLFCTLFKAGVESTVILTEGIQILGVVASTCGIAQSASLIFVLGLG